MLVALAAITGLNVNLHGGKDGPHAFIDEDEAQPPKVETTVSTTATPAQRAVDTGELPPEERVRDERLKRSRRARPSGPQRTR